MENVGACFIPSLQPSGAPPNMAPGSWSGPYAGDQITMPCGVGVPMAPMGPTGPAVAPVTMLPTGNPCDLDEDDVFFYVEWGKAPKMENPRH